MSQFSAFDCQNTSIIHLLSRIFHGAHDIPCASPFIASGVLSHEEFQLISLISESSFKVKRVQLKDNKSNYDSW
jgi:hypothetical protein